ncbi:MAG: TetR/AcrR family transcriptional regulator [Myxococcota bacterium]
MTPPNKRSAYHHGDLKRALADAAVELLAEVGPGFTLRQAAQRVGVTHTAAYRHFADRDALVAEVARRGFVQLQQQISRQIARASEPRARLEALMTGYIRFGWRHPAQYDVMFGPRLDHSDRFPALEAAVQGAIRLLQGVVAEFLGTDDRTQTRDYGMAVWSMMHGYTSMVLRRRVHVRSSRAAAQYLELLARPLLDGARRP